MRSIKILHYTSREARAMTRAIYVGIFSLVGVLLLTYYSLYTHATTISWEGTPKLTNKVSDVSDMQCSDRATIAIQGKASSDQACVEVGKNMRFATRDNGEFAVSFGSDQKYYTALMPCFYQNCHYFGESDLLVAFGGNPKAASQGPWFRSLNIYKNFSKNLLSRSNPDNPLVIEYLPRNYEPEYTFTKSLVAQSTTLEPIANAYKGFGVSDNGRWLVFEARNRGFFRLDLADYTLKRFHRFPTPHDYNPQIVQEFAVSNDGTRVLYTGENTTTSIFELSDECGDSPTDQEIYDSITLENPCPERHLDDFLSSQVAQYRYGKLPRFIDDSGNEFTLYARTNDYTKGAWLTVAAPGYAPVRLDYLALGDSYSSGEGDTELTKSGQKYYLTHTDQEENISLGIPKEKCHQSTRAYPFLLADYYSIPVGDKFQTVACSGATMNDISSIGAYNGQGGRLNGITSASNLQMQALDDFIPGRVRQLKFIERYQPKAITISIGGNDVKFGGLLSDCATSIRRCNAASIEGRKALGKTIKNQYKGLLSIYEYIRRAYPSTIVYVVGYPQVILDRDDVQCPLNTIGLDVEERKVMVAGYWYINQVIKTAAKKAGVRYLDTANALNGHRLCESDNTYANGVVLWGGEKEESFHPNAKGNAAMADEIRSIMGAQGLLDDDSYPTSDDSITENDIPDSDYLMTSSASTSDNVENANMTDSVVKKQNASQISLVPFSFKPMSSVSVVLHSDPIQLGNYVANSDGSLSTGVSFSSIVPAGYHTLIVSGESYSGEPIQYEQSILVEGSNTADVDENGVLDSTQKCGAFMYESGIDADYDGIDDACDPEIQDTQPYRVRNGDAAKGEKSDYIYIERNIHATDYTGVSGDLDPDGDGWAIVAQSTNAKNAGLPAHFWIDDSKIPHVSIRTDTRGCVQYTPRSLAAVKDNKIRSPKQESKNTSTCRKEDPIVDVDKDGTPDDKQQLYRARNGSVQAGESPNDIYLERNPTAAEAQLGISDYPHDRPWNTLASYHGAYPIQFVKLIVGGDKISIPTVIARQTKTNPKGKIITTCIALQPRNTNVITIKNQDRKLSKVSLPEGGKCE